MTEDLKSVIEYGLGQIEINKNLASESYDNEKLINNIIDRGYFIIKIPKNTNNEIIKEAGEIKIIGDNVINKFTEDFVPNGEYTKIIDFKNDSELTNFIYETYRTANKEIINSASRRSFLNGIKEFVKGHGINGSNFSSNQPVQGNNSTGKGKENGIPGRTDNKTI
ncbi:MAG TPA: hypothetical protein VIK14_17275 [Ignavibacteria bacterium]